MRKIRFNIEVAHEALMYAIGVHFIDTNALWPAIEDAIYFRYRRVLSSLLGRLVAAPRRQDSDAARKPMPDYFARAFDAMRGARRNGDAANICAHARQQPRANSVTRQLNSRWASIPHIEARMKAACVIAMKPPGAFRTERHAMAAMPQRPADITHIAASIRQYYEASPAEAFAAFLISQCR